MFSYLARVWQTRAAKRAENQFNGASATASSERALNNCDNFFALDSGAMLPHSEITS
jgi:hypothetical protein